MMSPKKFIPENAYFTCSFQKTLQRYGFSLVCTILICEDFCFFPHFQFVLCSLIRNVGFAQVTFVRKNSNRFGFSLTYS